MEEEYRVMSLLWYDRRDRRGDSAGPGRSFKERSGVRLNKGCDTSVLVSMRYVRVVGGLFSSVGVFLEKVGGEKGEGRWTERGE